MALDLEIIAEVEGAEMPARDGFVCDSLERATWAAAKLRGIRERQADIRALAEKRKAAWDVWAEHEAGKLDSDAERMEFYLRDYLQHARATDPKLKTITLPDATIKARKQQAQYERDEAQLLQWAKDNGYTDTFVKVKESLDWAALKKRLAPDAPILTDTGELIPGLVVMPGGETITVDVTTAGGTLPGMGE
jgi:hypothetical protein